MQWTEDKIQEAIELAKQHDTQNNLAVTLSQLWDEPISGKAIGKAFARNNLQVSDYLLGPSPRIKSSAEPTSQTNPHLEILRAVQRGAKTLENLCDSLGCTPSECRRRVAAAREAGYDLVVSDTTIAFQAVAEKPRVVSLEAPTPTATDPIVFAAISDTHFGAEEMALDEFHEFVDYAYSLGVRHIYHAGDVFEGTYHRGHQYEVAQAGFENQCRAALEGFPQKDGLNYWFITGNHDWNSFHKACGMDPGKEFAARAQMAGRDDIHHLGNTQGRVQMGDVRIEMAHPDGGTSYAKSYKMQKWVEKYEGGNKPHVLIFGHYHSYLVLEERNVTALHPGCWKFQGAFEQRKGLQPAVGGAIIWTWRDDTGMRFRHEWRRWWPRGVEWHAVD